MCTVENCNRPVHGRGMCDLHYQRWRKANPDKVRRRPVDLTVDDRFWRQVEGGDFETCWLWTGRPANAGYGKFVVRQKWYQAHRFAYERLIGPIPDGLDLDHLCRNRACVNPWHMDPVTRYVNSRRAQLGWRVSRDRTHPVETHCAQGHARTEANTYFPPNGRSPRCRTCNREEARRSKARRRASKEKP
jgi:hypothetical protein